MAQQDFTPGPWGYQEQSDAYTHIVRAGDGSLGGGRFICQLGQNTSGVSEANARLIAAAPELFDALENLLFEAAPYSPSGTYMKARERAASAIAKVRAEQVSA